MIGIYFLKKYETPKRVDLLSLDIDSMDFYVLHAVLSAGYIASIIVVEFNPVFRHDQAYTVRYNAKYRKDSTSNYGASLAAFNNLLKAHGYSLFFVLPSDTQSNNAMFILNELLDEDILLPSIEELHPSPWVESWKTKNPKGSSPKGIRNKLINSSFVEVDERGNIKEIS